MSALASSSPLHVEGGARFVPHIIRFKDIVPDLRASMTEVWDALGDLNRRNETVLPDTFTDRFLAQYLGRSRRFVQKGLKGLQDAGIIFRRTKYGRRNIEITGRIAGRKEQASAKGTGKGKSDPRAGQVPNLGPVPPATPEQLAAAAAAQARACEDPPVSPEDLAAAEEFLRQSRERRARAEAEAARRRDREQRRRQTPEEAKAALDRRRARAHGEGADPPGVDGDPKGP